MPTIKLYPWQGGLETISVPGATTLGRLQSGNNFVVDPSGYKRKSCGVTRQNNANQNLSPTGNTRGLFDFWRSNGFTKLRQVIFVSSGIVYAEFNNSGTYTDISTGSGLTINQRDNVYITAFGGLLIMGFDNNPNNSPVKYNQSGLIQNLGGTPPNIRYLQVFQNRLIGAGNPAAPDRVYLSAAGNPEDWTLGSGAETIDLDLGDVDPQGITGLMPPFFDRIVVGKRKALYEIFAVEGTFGVRVLVHNIGLLSHNSCQTVNNDVIFASDRGIHSLAMTDKLGELETGFLSYPIQDLYANMVNFARAGNMRSAYSPEMASYFLAFTSNASDANDYVFVYNFALQEWGVFQENVSAFSSYVDPMDNNKTAILVADDQGRIGVLDTRSSSSTGKIVTWFGERVETNITTGLIYPASPERQCVFKNVMLFYKPQTTRQGSPFFTMTYLVDGQTVETLTFDMTPIKRGSLIGSAVIGVDIIGASGRLIKKGFEIKGVGQSIEFVINHQPQDDEEGLEIYGFTLDFDVLGESNERAGQ